MDYKEEYICTKCSWRKEGHEVKGLSEKGIERFTRKAKTRPMWEAPCPKCGGKVKQKITTK